MKILKFLLILIVGVIAVILIAALFIPKTYHVERAVLIHAPKPLVVSQIKSLKNMNEWSPWAKQDPDMKVVYSGTDGEVGSSSSWESKKMGVGSQTVTKLTEDSMETDLVFEKPYKSKSLAFFQFNNVDQDVKVIWGMQGQNPYPFNFMCLFMDNLLGKDYAKGLASLKERCEKMNTGTSN